MKLIQIRSLYTQTTYINPSVSLQINLISYSLFRIINLANITWWQRETMNIPAPEKLDLSNGKEIAQRWKRFRE